MLSSKVKFSADKQTDRQTDRQADRRTPVTQHAPIYQCGGIKSINHGPRRLTWAETFSLLQIFSMTKRRYSIGC